MDLHATDGHACVRMPAGAPLTGDEGKHGYTMPIGRQRCRKALGFSERGQFEDAIEPVEQVATLTQCTPKHSPFGINQVEPETHWRDHLFRGDNHTYCAGGPNR